MIKRITVPLSLLLCIVTCGIFGWYQYVYYSIIPTYQKKLSAIADSRSHEINTYLNEQEKNAIQLSQEPLVIKTLNKISQDEEQTLSNLISAHKEHMGFKSVLLIDKDGTVIFSTTKKNLVHENLNNHTDSSLGKSY